MISPGGPNRAQGVCEEADQAEPTRQHQQQGEEADQELHDDEAQSERPSQRQTLLQRQTSTSQPSDFMFRPSSLDAEAENLLFMSVQIALREALLRKKKQHK